VKYGRLADIGRRVVEERVARPLGDRVKRTTLKEFLPRGGLFKPAFKAGQLARPLLPYSLRDKLQPARQAGPWPRREHARKMLVLAGCVQPAMAPDINAATARVLDSLGVQLIEAPKAGCCGAVRYHMNDQDGGLQDMRRNIDAWWPYVENGGVEAIVMTASGCGVTVKEYGHLLARDQAYAAKAERISAMTKDLSEIMQDFEGDIGARMAGRVKERIAFHPPCTLQHGQQIRGKVEGVLRAAGVDVVLCADSHLCCGSAGTYSVLHPEIAHALRDRKVANLEATGAKEIVSANIGCITHLQSGTALPVTHWIELVDRALAGAVAR
jgi:glycolate oxidase iron-sulfur subunit